MGRPLLRFILRSLKYTLPPLFLLAILLAGWKIYDDRTILTRYRVKTNGLQGLRELRNDSRDGMISKLMELDLPNGDTLPFRICFPAEYDADGALKPPNLYDNVYGCLIINYGIGQNLRFFDRIEPIFRGRKLVVIMPEQYECGLRRKEPRTLWRRFVNLRERPARLVGETLTLLDLVHSMPMIHPAKIDYMGVSYGGIVGSALLKSSTFRSATLVMAGADLPLMVGSLIEKYRPESRLLWPGVARFGAWWVSPFEPSEHIALARTERLLFLQVEPDELIPLASREALYNAAPEPKVEMIYPGPHNRPTAGTITQMISDALDWMGHPASPEAQTASAIGEPVSSGRDTAQPTE